MAEAIYDLLLYLSWIAYIVAISTVVYTRSRSLSFTEKLLLLFLIFGILVDWVGFALIFIKIDTNLLVYFYSVFILPIIYFIYSGQIQSYSVKLILGTITLLHVFFGLIYFLHYPKLIMSDFLYSIVEIIVIFLAFFYLYQVLKRLEINNLTHHFFFWINSAFMIYFGMCFFLYLFEGILRSDPELFFYTWHIQLVATILMNLTLIIGAWKTRRI